MKWLTARICLAKRKIDSASCAAGEWRPLLKVKAREKECLSFPWEYAAGGVAVLCGDTHQPREHQWDDDPQGYYACLLKNLFSFPSFLPLFQSKGFVAVSLPYSSEAFGHMQPEGESCMLQDESLQLPYILHTEVSFVLSCSISSSLRNMFK